MIKNFTIVLMLTALALTGCKSNISLEDMQKQESKAMSELNSAKEELVELANMKEQYSIDIREAQVKTLEKRQKQLSKDIKNIKNVETSSAQSSAENMVDNLKNENATIEKKISSLKSIKQEDWTATKDSIQSEIARLHSHITQLTSNVEALNKMEVE